MLQNKIDADHNTLQIALDKTEQKAQKSIDQNTTNQEELKHLKSWFNEQRKIQKTTEFINRLEQVIEDLKNESLRSTIIFWDISKSQIAGIYQIHSNING